MLTRRLTAFRKTCARLLARLFHRLCDPELEHEMVQPDEYVRIQNLRRLEVERFLKHYLGPRL